jgi:hypothetical protein
MQEQHIRHIIRKILQEEDTMTADSLRNPMSLKNRTLVPAGQPKKLLIISPGIDNASGPGFSWKEAAPAHVKLAIEAGLPERGVGVVVAPNSKTPLAAVIREIGNSKDARIMNLLGASTRVLLGFSGGGGNVIRFVAAGDPHLSTISKIYLADPAATMDSIGLIPRMGSNADKITMTYNPDNWSGPNESFKKSLPAFASKFNQYVGKSAAQLEKKTHIEHLKDMLAII